MYRSRTRNPLRLLAIVGAILALLIVPAVVLAQGADPPAAPALNATDLQALVGIGGVPVVLAIVGIAKRYVDDDRAYPVMALVFGVVWNIALALLLVPPMPIGPAILAGVLCGLTAAGSVSVIKTATKPRPAPAPTT